MKLVGASSAGIIAGQLFSAVGAKSIAVGCAVSALLIGVIATFGIGIVNAVGRFVSFSLQGKNERLTSFQIRIYFPGCRDPHPCGLCWSEI